MAFWLQLANITLLCITIAPLFVKVEPNFNCIVTACLTVYIGCKRSVKPTPPSETISKEHAMRFPLIGSGVLLSLFLLFKFLPKDLINRILSVYFISLGIVALSATILPVLENILPKQFSEQNLLTVKIPFLQTFQLTKSEVIAGIPASGFCVWYMFKKHWLANNVLGIAFSIEGIELLSLGSFKIGAILLVGLFFYDIFWVFFTPVMVSVAKSFDAPIKLLFPTANLSRPFSMLGLGDIVIPGIFVALALRFDASQKRGQHYFNSAFAGYFLGLGTTLIVMNWFQAAQPALLYIVPGVLGSLGIHCALKNEIKELLAYDESTTSDSKSTQSSTEDTVDTKID